MTLFNFTGTFGNGKSKTKIVEYDSIYPDHVFVC